MKNVFDVECHDCQENSFEKRLKTTRNKSSFGIGKITGMYAAMRKRNKTKEMTKMNG